MMKRRTGWINERLSGCEQCWAYNLNRNLNRNLNDSAISEPLLDIVYLSGDGNH
jgi:hypothetical protein